ncbi:MAG: glycosyltransferase family 39 protein [Rhodocyclaceae bacterium]
MQLTDRQLKWLLFLLPLAAFLLNLGGMPLFDVDEGAFSEATREMFERHDFLSTWLNGAPRFDKPILVYWFQAIFVALFGVNEWAFRLPSVISAALWAWATAMFVWPRVGRNGAIFAATIVTTSLGVLIIGRAATADSLLNVLIALALFDSWRHLESGQRAPLLRSYVWIGLGVLTKGPIALLVPGATTLIYCLTAKRFRDWLRSVFDWQGWLILLAITVPWYAAALAIHGQAFIDGFLLKHNVERFSGSMEGHSGSIFYYVAIVPVLLLPWLTWLLRSVRDIRSDFSDPLRRFLWIWSIFVIAFFSLSGTKLPHYALYGCTPLFALMALNIDKLGTSTRSVRLAVLPAILLLCVFVGLPSLLEDALQRGWVKDAYYQLQLGRVSELKLLGYHAIVVLCFAISLQSLFTLHSEAWKRSAIAASVCALAVVAAVGPLTSELLQGPVKRAGIAARQYAGEPMVLWNFHAPSFSVYRESVTPTVQAEAGQIALTRVDRLPKDRKVEELFREGGVVLVRVKE